MFQVGSRTRLRGPIFNLVRAKSADVTHQLEQTGPLRILFCGSDEFSSACLKAIHTEQYMHPTRIASIDVLCRPGKPSGRALKEIRHLPVKKVAHELGLPVHEQDTFTGWDPPRRNGSPINLIIAASFGLLVPRRILSSAMYGGLNVHPSALPDFYGPAPLEHMILRGSKRFCVTIQRMDTKGFDRGPVLLHTASPGLSIPNSEDITIGNLKYELSSRASKMLVWALRNEVYVNPDQPRKDDSRQVPQSNPQPLVHAHKLERQHKQIGVEPWNPLQVDRQFRALGRVWAYAIDSHGAVKSLLIDEMEKLRYDRSSRIAFDHPVDELEGRASPRYLTLSPEIDLEKCKDKLQRIPYIIDGDGIIFCTPHHPESPSDIPNKLYDKRSWVLKVSKMTVSGDASKKAKVVVNSIR